MVRVRFRVLIGAIIIVLVVVNLLVLLYGESSMTDGDANDTRDKDWEEAPEHPEEPEVHEDVQGPDPGDEPKS